MNVFLRGTVFRKITFSFLFITSLCTKAVFQRNPALFTAVTKEALYLVFQKHLLLSESKYASH